MARSFREAEEASNAANYLQQAGADQRTINALKYADPADIQTALQAAKQKQNAQAALDAENAAKAEQARLDALNKGKNANMGNNQNQNSSATDALIQQMIAQQNAAVAQAQLAKQQARQSAIDVVTARFAQYGLQSLASKITELATDGATEATITLALQQTPEYQQRFSANADRIKKGLSVLAPADYLNLEDSYRQTLRAYGLKQFDNDAYVKQFIANDVSATELSNRVVTAVQRVQNADPAILSQLTDYYGIGQGDLVAYVLDPNQQFQKIQRQVSAAEIGVAAAKQGLQSNVGVSEQLAAQGIDQATAQKGYATIADILPTAEKLSQIYGPTAGTYNQSTAEQDVFNQLASAQRARKKLTDAEAATFNASSGTIKGSPPHTFSQSGAY